MNNRKIVAIALALGTMVVGVLLYAYLGKYDNNGKNFDQADSLDVNTDYFQIIMYGQSISMGWEAPEALTTEEHTNTYMIGSSPMITYGNDYSSTINSLSAKEWIHGGEQPIVALTNSFEVLYNKKYNTQQKFIGTSCGEGGMSIERLLKECTVVSKSTGKNIYQREFEYCLETTKKACENEASTVSCPVIVFVQGESNYSGVEGLGIDGLTDATRDKEKYKEYLSMLKKEMQQDVVSVYEQENVPIFAISQVGGSFISNQEMTINTAVKEFAAENDDVILLTSYYAMPDYNGLHLSTNGYRWFGELLAKQIFEVLVEDNDYATVQLADVDVNNNNIILNFDVPTLPLVFDEQIVEPRFNYGFQVYMNSNEIPIQKLEISENSVIITCGNELSGKIEVVYAGAGSGGTGNLRDSDMYESLYTYYDDRASSGEKQEDYTPVDSTGNKIYNEKYPMYNWCDPFYYSIEVS